MAPAERLRCHARSLGELVTECQSLSPGAVATRRGLVRKLGFEAAVHARLAAEAGDDAAARTWDALAHMLERAWGRGTPAEATLAVLEATLRTPSADRIAREIGSTPAPAVSEEAPLAIAG